MIRLRASFILAIWIASLAHGAPRRDVLAHASDDRYWVVQILPAGGAANWLRSAVRMRDSNSAYWQFVAVLRGRVVDVAHHQNNAALLMDDQSWVLAWPGGLSTGPQLPAGALMHSLAADGQSLWALGVRTDEPPEAGQRLGDSSTQIVAYAFEDGSWRPIAALPAQVRQDLPLSMAVFAGRPMVAWLEAPSELSYTRLTNDGQWSPVERISTDFKIADFRLLDRTPMPAIWLAPQATVGELHLRREHWGPAVPLRDSKLPAGATNRSAEFFAGNLRLVALHEGQLLEQAFTLEGAPVGDAVNLGRTPPPAAPPISGWSLLLLGASAMLLTAAVFRREEGEPLEFGKDRWRLAPLPRRIGAGLIDLSPLVIVAVWAAPWGDIKSIGGTMTAEQFLARLIIALSTYLLHTTLLELATGRSFGKLIFRLRVVNLDGKPPSRSAILIRNVLRVVDINPVLPLSILILFSPLRQRLGDVLAKTIVVTAAPVVDEPNA